MREYAKSRGVRVVEEYVDQRESAKTGDRPQFREMMKQCQKDKTIDALIVHEID